MTTEINSKKLCPECSRKVNQHIRFKVERFEESFGSGTDTMDLDGLLFDTDVIRKMLCVECTSALDEDISTEEES